ncbi:MAG: TIGR00341 family protein [Bacteroidales bacterium]|nr:TIGR00341 family protein [Bacteroidales bacterium]
MKKTKFASISEYLKSLINISNDCDAESTIQNISQNIEFKGVNVWILVFAIFLASIGLNVNSTAVIIGAMLVSPLMGPIMGCGLAIGISDLKMLKKSLKNLFVMTIISLLVSTLYFTLTPLSDAQSELLARTRPTLFDVMIASFGGFAGIVASSRKKEMTTVVSGVAIATALMPPLCTAGFGLGTGQINYFFGAFYLFFINSFFIALATFLIVKYLDFPELVYVDEKRRKNVRRSIAIFSIIVITPSIFMAINVVQETAINSYSRKYISDIEQSELFPDVQIIKNSLDFKTHKMEIAFVGKQLTDEQTQFLHKHLIDCGLDNFTLSIKQAGSPTFDLNKQSQIIQDLLDKKDSEIEKSDSIIVDLKEQIAELQTQSKTNMSKFAKELTILQPNIEKFSIGENDQYNLQQDSVVNMPIITLYWKSRPDHASQEQIESWIRIRLENPSIIIENK